MPDHFSKAQHFGDFEEFAATADHYDIEKQQLDRGRFAATQ